MNNNMRNKGRGAIYGMAGFYLIYMAYQIFKNRAESAGGEYAAVMIGAAAFLVIGIGLIVFGFYAIYKIEKEMRNASAEKQEPKDSEMEQEKEKLDIS